MNLRKVLSSALISLIFASNASAIVGAGFHWGFDFSTSMTDKDMDVVFTTDSIPNMPDQLKGEPFLYISRTNFERTPINFGGKVFIDVLPIEFEVSMNMGFWQYDGAINYASGIDTTGVGAGGTPSLTYSSNPVTIEKISGVSYPGVTKTPYGKFNIDASIKKTFKKIPVVKPSIGAGVSAHFATPVLSSELVNDALNLGDMVSSMPLDELASSDALTSPDAYKKIMEAITEGGKKPKTGMHFLLGIKIKPPVVPLALYVDGKYMLLFSEIEDGLGFETKGFLVNAGIMFNI